MANPHVGDIIYITNIDDFTYSIYVALYRFAFICIIAGENYLCQLIHNGAFVTLRQDQFKLMNQRIEG